MKTRFPNDTGILAVDLEKSGFQVCATASEGDLPCNRKFTRPKLKKFLEAHSPCPVAMEACSTSHHWAGGAGPPSARGKCHHS